MRPKAELVNATINVLDRVPKEYLTVCQTEVTTKNIEFSFVINRLMVKYQISVIFQNILTHNFTCEGHRTKILGAKESWESPLPE